MARRWRRRTTLAALAGAATTLMVSLCLDAGAGTAAAQTSAQGPLPLPTLPALPALPALPLLPSPSLSLPPLEPPQVTLPTIELPILTPPTVPSTTPSARPTTPSGGTPPTTGAPPASATPAPPASAGPTVDPGSAAEVIASDPAAELYPQPPVDAANSPQARQVAALGDVQHRIQYLQNVLARTRADLGTVARESDPVLQLLTALTTGADADPTAPFAVADSSDVLDTPTGRAVALSGAITSGQAELTRRQQEEARLRQEIDRRIRAASTLAAPAPHALGGGRLGRPLSGRLTSRFGNRLDPYYHVWQVHPGVDLAAPLGTPIVAAADGRVTRAGWYGGYGNYTCIDHGRADGQRLSTCYGHQSKLLVSPGQRVRAGQVIGLVGSTGASTGPHLHFEVRLGGRAVDPLPWI
ncbi:Peptidase family M23 [Micromonospora viridifaciens]|uniref:Peptidase family M23 n=1 Tax=Micromonospora viridifaciens TaxID=1881 RepID=A0A1C4YB84_MICVI|nr:M23 family metallopeptidase [Micromonospora viridifaciens]SCF17581.1 Peptidase family M23 [Micromonospora viridifaciens]